MLTQIVEGRVVYCVGAAWYRLPLNLPPEEFNHRHTHRKILNDKYCQGDVNLYNALNSLMHTGVFKTYSEEEAVIVENTVTALKKEWISLGRP